MALPPSLVLESEESLVDAVLPMALGKLGAEELCAVRDAICLDDDALYDELMNPFDLTEPWDAVHADEDLMRSSLIEVRYFYSNYESIQDLRSLLDGRRDSLKFELHSMRAPWMSGALGPFLPDNEDLAGTVTDTRAMAQEVNRADTGAMGQEVQHEQQVNGDEVALTSQRSPGGWSWGVRRYVTPSRRSLRARLAAVDAAIQMLDDASEDDSDDSVLQRHRRASLANQLSGYGFKRECLSRLALELNACVPDQRPLLLRRIETWLNGRCIEEALRKASEAARSERLMDEAIEIWAPGRRDLTELDEDEDYMWVDDELRRHYVHERRNPNELID